MTDLKQTTVALDLSRSLAFPCVATSPLLVLCVTVVANFFCKGRYKLLIKIGSRPLRALEQKCQTDPGRVFLYLGAIPINKLLQDFLAVFPCLLYLNAEYFDDTRIQHLTDLWKHFFFLLRDVLLEIFPE
jgi:hypothetical protein